LITIANRPALVASIRENQKEINKKENKPINSQQINKEIKLLEVTNHNIEQVKACNQR
jgi:hypothetical protein